MTVATNDYDITSSVRFSDRERDTGVPDSESISRAFALFSEHGFVRLENVFSPQFMVQLTKSYSRRYRMYLEGTYQNDKRPLFTVDVEGVFNDPTFYANPLMLPFIKKCVGDQCIVGAMSSVASFPGAPDQFIHRDSLPIFGGDYEIDKDIPTYAMTVLIPLVDCNRQTGCTKVWPGSHLRNDPKESESHAPLEPEVRVGSVLITSSKLIHRGGANVSDKLRPLVYMTYHRSWFRDFWGYETRPPVNVSARQLAKVPAEYRHMFAWTKDQYAQIRTRNSVKRLFPFKLVSAVRSLARR